MAKAVLSLREREYFEALNRILDQLFEDALARDWGWSELARRAGLSTATVYRLGNRETRFPRFSTVWMVSRAVGGVLELRLQRAKAARKKKA